MNIIVVFDEKVFNKEEEEEQKRISTNSYVYKIKLKIILKTFLLFLQS